MNATERLANRIEFMRALPELKRERSRLRTPPGRRICVDADLKGKAFRNALVRQMVAWADLTDKRSPTTIDRPLPTDQWSQRLGS